LTLTGTRLGSVFKTHQLSEENHSTLWQVVFSQAGCGSEIQPTIYDAKKSRITTKTKSSIDVTLHRKHAQPAKKTKRVKARDSVKFLKFFLARVAYSGDKFCLLAVCCRSANRSHVNEKRNVYSNLTVNALTSLSLRFQHVNKFSSVSEAVLMPTLLLLLLLLLL